MLKQKQIESLDFLCYFCLKTNPKVYQIGSYRNALVSSFTWPELLINYYPFSSTLPTRSWSDASRAYRFGFNTQEKDNEIAGENNSYTAEFWQYNSMLIRRWNLDPQPQVNNSDYSVNKLNPVLFHDWRGNVWTIGTDNNSKSDVLNLVSSKNKDYVKIAADRSVSLNFGGKSKKKIERILKKDEGQVCLAPGEIIYSYCTQVGQGNKTICYISNVRILILMHELYENYLRTSEKLSYDEAHKKVNELFWEEFSGTLTVKR